MNPSMYYLERVGHEAKMKLRHDLRPGRNLVGRSKKYQNNIDVDIDIDSLCCSKQHCIITVNNDEILIQDLNSSNGTTVNGNKIKNEMKISDNDLIGIVNGFRNLNELVGNYSYVVFRLCKYGENNLPTIEIDDDEPIVLDEDDDDIIFVSDDDQPDDLDIILSRHFNSEIKQELKEIDENEEEYFTILKQEQFDYDESHKSPMSFSYFENEQCYAAESPKPCSSRHIEEENENCIDNVSIASHDSDVTVFYDIVRSKEQQLSLSDDMNCLEDEHLDIESQSMVCDHNNTEAEKENVQLEDKLQKVVSNLSHENKRNTIMIDAQPLNKRNKKSSIIEKPCTKLLSPKNKRLRSEKLKLAAAQSETKEDIETVPKAKTRPKVKMTPNNRGAFFTDPSQQPSLPVSRKNLLKKSIPTTQRKIISDDLLTSDITPAELEVRISENLKLPAVNSLPFNSVDNNKIDDINICNNNENNVICLDSDDEDGIDQLLSEIDPIFEEIEPKLKERPVVEQETKQYNFQHDPRHDIISALTACDLSDIKIKSANFQSVPDIFESYDDYQRIITTLMKIELWREIEYECNSPKEKKTMHVNITDQNIEKRGNGQRLVIHGQMWKQKSQSISRYHIVICSTSQHNFLACIEFVAYKEDKDGLMAHFTMETGKFNTKLDCESLEIQLVTNVSNTMHAFMAVYNLEKSKLLNFVLNPLTCKLPQSLTVNEIDYVGFTSHLDDNQISIIKKVYKRCINPNEPNISLIDGGAGTGKTTLIYNLALQLVYGHELREPLRILICSVNNKSIDEITQALIKVREKTSCSRKINLVRYGFLENMDSRVRCVSLQHLQESSPFSTLQKLYALKSGEVLKKMANEDDPILAHKHYSNINFMNAQIKRIERLGRKRELNTEIVVTNTADIICTTIGSIPKLQQLIHEVHVCIIDESTECNEPLTFMPFNFGMSSLVLFGDSARNPIRPYSDIVKQANFGNSLFGRFQKVFQGKLNSPIFELNVQYRMHESILKWPNFEFYKNRLYSHKLTKDETFPIKPYSFISYAYPQPSTVKEMDVMNELITYLIKTVNYQMYSISVICPNTLYCSVTENKLRIYPYISVHTPEPYLCEKDVVVLWIGTGNNRLGLFNHAKVLNMVLTRAKKSLIVCGFNLNEIKGGSMWQSLVSNARKEKRFYQMKNFAHNYFSSILLNQQLKSKSPK